MNIDLALSLSQDMLWNAVLLGAPVLGVSLLVGLLISIFQVVTQIQEMTLTFVPKILAIVIVIFVMGQWMLNTLVSYASQLILGIPSYF